MVHKHCQTCYSAHCKFEPIVEYNSKITDGCQVLTCPNICGMTLHECKLEEHLAHTCQNQTVDCINSLYGCPHEYPRYKTKSHIHHCPASVVTCKMEWNRWQRTPLQDSDRLSVDQTLSSTLSSDLLDVSLAARDQRVLGESLKMPRRLRRSLRNSYTKNFPAVPLVQRYSDMQDTEACMEESSDSLDFLAVDEEDRNCLHQISFSPPGGRGLPAPAVHCSLCKARASRDNNGLASSITGALSQMRQEQEISMANMNQTSSHDSGLELEGRSDSDASIKPATRRSEVSVDLVMEMFNSFRSKPMKMLTFLCAQDFRRDQFTQHYLNIHQDIQAGLDGWYQMRCPLSVNGCQFTQQRFISDKKDKIVYNPVTECFSVTSVPGHMTANVPGYTDRDWLSNLPELVLIILFSYMDSLSIKNLSLTSKVMRQKCEYLLRNNGMVTQNWRKVDGNWKVFQKIWSFSSSFQKVRSWYFNDVPSMANHLQVCPYNDRQTFSVDRVRVISAMTSSVDTQPNNAEQTETQASFTSDSMVLITE